MSQYIEDDVEMSVAYRCERGCFSQDSECDFGGWHNEDQIVWVRPSQVFKMLQRLEADDDA